MWLKKRFNALRRELSIYLLLKPNNDRHRTSEIPNQFINIIRNDLKGDHYLHKSEKNAYRDYSRYHNGFVYVQPHQQQQQRPFIDMKSTTLCDHQLKKINVS